VAERGSDERWCDAERPSSPRAQPLAQEARRRQPRQTRSGDRHCQGHQVQAHTAAHHGDRTNATHTRPDDTGGEGDAGEIRWPSPHCPISGRLSPTTHPRGRRASLGACSSGTPRPWASQASPFSPGSCALAGSRLSPEGVCRRPGVPESGDSGNHGTRGTTPASSSRVYAHAAAPAWFAASGTFELSRCRPCGLDKSLTGRPYYRSAGSMLGRGPSRQCDDPRVSPEWALRSPGSSQVRSAITNW
jgi:hypothetical protein